MPKKWYVFFAYLVLLSGCGIVDTSKVSNFSREPLIGVEELQRKIEKHIPSAINRVYYEDKIYREVNLDGIVDDTGKSFSGYIAHLNDCDDAILKVIARYHEYAICFIGYDTFRGAHALGVMYTTDKELYFINPQRNEMRRIRENEIVDHINVRWGFCM